MAQDYGDIIYWYGKNIIQDSYHRLVTDTQIDYWNKKAEADHNHNDIYYSRTEIDNKLSNISAGIHTSFTWNDITGKPSTFPPSVHNHDDLYSKLGHQHTIANISGLQTALDSKAGSSHNHDDRYYTETEINDKLANISVEKLKNDLVIKFNGGDADNYNQFTYNGSKAIEVNITPEKINAMDRNPSDIELGILTDNKSSGSLKVNEGANKRSITVYGGSINGYSDGKSYEIININPDGPGFFNNTLQITDSGLCARNTYQYKVYDYTINSTSECKTILDFDLMCRKATVYDNHFGTGLKLDAYIDKMVLHGNNWQTISLGQLYEIATLTTNVKNINFIHPSASPWQYTGYLTAEVPLGLAEGIYRIGTSSTDTYGVGISKNANAFIPMGQSAENMSLGTSYDYQKWSYVYATNGTIQTSNELKKTILESGIDNRYEELYEKLEPIAFKWNNETADGSNHDRIHLGLGAQTTKKHMDEVGISAEEYALYCEDSILDKDGNEIDKEYGINYGQLHALHIHMIQKMQKEIDDLKAELAALKDK